jgi:hypothetical protein
VSQVEERRTHEYALFATTLRLAGQPDGHEGDSVMILSTQPK